MQEVTSNTCISLLDAIALLLFVFCTPHSLLEHFRAALLPSSTGLVTINLDAFGCARGLLSSLGASLSCYAKSVFLSQQSQWFQTDLLKLVSDQ